MKETLFYFSRIGGLIHFIYTRPSNQTYCGKVAKSAWNDKELFLRLLEEEECLCSTCYHKASRYHSDLDEYAQYCKE